MLFHPGALMVGRGPTLDGHVGLGTTAMPGVVPLVLSFRLWLSINPKWAVTAKLLECYCRSHFCVPLALTDFACSCIKLACLLDLTQQNYRLLDSFNNEPRLQHLNSASCNISAVEQNLTLEWCPTLRERPGLGHAQLGH